SLISGIPSALSADGSPSLFEWFIGTMPLCDSSKTYARAVWLLPSPADLRPFGGRCLRGLPVLVHEVSSRVWGLRLRRTDLVLALSRLLMLPSAHYKDVGVRISSFRS